MVEKASPKTPSFTSFEVRRNFFKDAIWEDPHLLEPSRPDHLRRNDWVSTRNILAIYYLTNASVKEIAEKYKMLGDWLKDIVYWGTMELYRNCTRELQIRYPVGGFRGGSQSMEKPRRHKATTKMGELIKEVEAKTNAVKPGEIAIEQVVPEQPDRELIIQQLNEEVLEEGEEDVDRENWEFLINNNLVQKALDKGYISEWDVRKAKELFEGKTVTRNHVLSTLDKISLAVAKLS